MKRIYPWEEWFRARRITLLRGVHYGCSQSTMAQTIRNNASLRGLRVRIEDIGTGLIMEVIGEIPCANQAPIVTQYTNALAPDGAP